MANLITCSDVGKYLGVSIADATVKAKIDCLIKQASAAIEKWCDRTFTETVYREWYDGNGTCYLKTNQYRPQRPQRWLPHRKMSSRRQRKPRRGMQEV